MPLGRSDDVVCSEQLLQADVADPDRLREIAHRCRPRECDYVFRKGEEGVGLPHHSRLDPATRIIEEDDPSSHHLQVRPT